MSQILLKRSLIVLCYFKNCVLIVKKSNCFLEVSCYRAFGVIQVLNMDTYGQFWCVMLLEASVLYLTYRRPMILQKLVGGQRNVLRHPKWCLAPDFIWNVLLLLCLLHTYFSLALEFLFAPEVLCWKKMKSYIWSCAILPVTCLPQKNSKDRSRSCQVLSI